MNKSIAIIPFCIAAALVAFFFVFYQEKSVDSVRDLGLNPTNNHGPQTNEPSFNVHVAVVRRGNLIKRLVTSGTLRARRAVNIVSKHGGEVESVQAQNGSFVKRGQELVRFDQQNERLALENAAGALLGSQIEYKTQRSSPIFAYPDSLQNALLLIEARDKLKTLESHYQKGLVSDNLYQREHRDYETDIAYFSADRSDVIASKSGLTRAKVEYEKAKEDLEWTSITAPFDGYVANCLLSEGMRVNQGETVLQLLDLSSLFVDVDILESEISKVHVGEHAQVLPLARPGEIYAGIVKEVNPIVDSKSKAVRVTLEIDDAKRGTTLRMQHLFVGMFATVSVQTTVFKNRLLAPKSALLIRDQRPLVFLARGGVAEWRYIDLGEQNDELIEILSGVQEGDTIITAGQYTLAHEARIIPILSPDDPR